MILQAASAAWINGSLHHEPYQLILLGTAHSRFQVIKQEVNEWVLRGIGESCGAD